MYSMGLVVAPMNTWDGLGMHYTASVNRNNGVVTCHNYATSIDTTFCPGGQ